MDSIYCNALEIFSQQTGKKIQKQSEVNIKWEDWHDSSTADY